MNSIASAKSSKRRISKLNSLNAYLLAPVTDANNSTTANDMSEKEFDMSARFFVLAPRTGLDPATSRINIKAGCLNIY